MHGHHAQYLNIYMNVYTMNLIPSIRKISVIALKLN